MARRGPREIDPQTGKEIVSEKMKDPEGEVIEERVGQFEARFDEAHALEAYRKIRAGSLKGANMSREMFKRAKELLGPDWKAKVTENTEKDEARERAQAERGDEPHPH
jgi:hypothetical protein